MTSCLPVLYTQRISSWILAVACVLPVLPLIAQPLPRLEWSTYHGGTLEDGFRDMAIDADANIYVTGSTLSPNAIATPGSHLATAAGLSDVYIAKYNADGMLLWSTYFGGFQNDYGQSITVDDLGYIYVTGFTASGTGIATAGAYQMTNNGGFADAFIAKFDPDGNRLWATYFGGSADERANSICVDNTGNVTIIGWTNSTSLIASPGAFQTTFQGQQDIFLAHFDTDGTRLWSTYFGFDGFDIGLQVMADASRDLFISGWTSSAANMTTPGAFKTTYGGGTADTYLAKFSENGTRLWCTYYGGSIDEYGDALLVTGDNHIYLAGPCNSPDGISTPGSHQPSTAGGFDSFLVKFDGSGSRIWGTYVGGNNDDLGYGLAIDAEQSIYLTGYTQSNGGIATANAHQTTPGGDWDAYVTRFTGDGTRLWGTYLGGSAIDQSLGVEVDSSGYVYISGLTVSPNQISTTGSYQEIYGGGDSDGFVSKFSPCTDPVVSFNNGGYLCDGSNFVFDLTFTGHPPYTLVYSLDGVEQAPVIALSSPFFFPVTEPWSDSIKLLSVSSGPCRGQVTGLFDFVKTVDSIATSNINILCDQMTETYTVSGDLSGGIFNYLSAGATPLFITGNQFTSNALPFQTPFDIAITSGLNCDTVFLAGPSGCKIQCPDSFGIITPDTLVCQGTDIFLHADGGIMYQWAGPDNFTTTTQNPVILTASPIHEGSYTVTITDEDGCMDTLMTTVTVQVVPGSIAGDTQLCSGEDLQLQAGGGISYEWSGPDGFQSSIFNPQISNTTTTHSGTYQVTITDINGCTASLSTDVIIHPLPVATVSSNSPVCEGTDLFLQSAGGMDYLWSGPGGYSSTLQNPVIPGASATHAGWYTVMVTDAQGCSSTDSVLIDVTLSPDVMIQLNGTLCEGTTLELSGTGAASYAWTGPGGFSSTLQDPVIMGLGTVHNGTYTLTGTAAGGCMDTTSIDIDVHPAPVIMVTALDSSICEGEQLQLNVTMATGYQWSGPEGFTSVSQSPSIAFMTVLQSGIYAVTVTDALMCTAEGQVEIMVNNAPDIVFTDGESATCEGGVVWATVSGGASLYAWTGPNGFVSNGNMITITNATADDSGWYVVTGLNMNHCQDIDSIEWIIYPVPDAMISGPAEICVGESVELTGAGGSSFLWNTGETGSTLTTMPSDTTEFVLIVTEGPCQDTTYFTVAVNPLPMLTISSPVTITQHESTLLTISGAETYTWEPPFTLDCASCPETMASPDTTTLYCVTGNVAECETSTCVLVTVAIDCRFRVPNIFSPNFDGVNDLWCSPQPDCYDEQQLTIYDRWGNVLFESTGQDVCWDGTTRGHEVPPGVYVYMLELRKGLDQPSYLSGDITVMR